MTRNLTAAQESWPIAGSFRISRGAKTEAHVVVVEITDGEHRGRGECVPYARYGETVEGVLAEIDRHAGALEAGIGRDELQTAMPAGAARNAVDCALWDLEAKQAGTPAWQLAGLERMVPVTTAYTLSLDTPEGMAAAAREASARPLIKVKLGLDGDEERLRAIREAAPRSKLIIDANEGWSRDRIEPLFALCAEVGVTLIEQPLPADDDALLADIAPPRPCLRRRVNSRPGQPGRSCRALRRHQHQARQDRRADRGACPVQSGRGARPRHHGRLHAGDLARHGAGHDRGSARLRGRSGRTPAACPRPRARHHLRRQRHAPAAPGTVGLSVRVAYSLLRLRPQRTAMSAPKVSPDFVIANS